MKKKYIKAGVITLSLLIIASITAIMVAAVKRSDNQKALTSEVSESRLTFITPDEISLDYTEAEASIKEMITEYGFSYKIVNPDELEKALECRDYSVIVERCIGKVIDADTGDGIILNSYTKPNYINYSKMQGLRYSDYNVTYFIYNPFNNCQDDIIERFDFKITNLEVSSSWQL